MHVILLSISDYHSLSLEQQPDTNTETVKSGQVSNQAAEQSGNDKIVVTLYMIIAVTDKTYLRGMSEFFVTLIETKYVLEEERALEKPTVDQQVNKYIPRLS
jgi:hypothetical protein